VTSHRVGLTQVSVIGPSEGVWLRLPLTGAVVTYSLSLAPRPKRTVFGGRDPVVQRGGMGAKALAAALSRLKPQPVAPTGSTSGVGFG